MNSRVWCYPLLALLLTNAAWAQGAHSGTPSVNAIIDQLKGDESDGVASGRTRSLELGAASQAASAARKPAAPASISMQIHFDFNSDRINAASAQAMNNLSQALSSNELQGRRFRIVGHTDGVGSAGYNLALSKRRAAAVQDYLIRHGVDNSRLTATGVGMNELLNKADPGAAENRRVVIEAQDG